MTNLLACLYALLRVHLWPMTVSQGLESCRLARMQSTAH